MAGDPESGTLLASMKSVTDGAGLHVIGRVLGKVIGFLLNLLLTRGLGAALYGVYAFGVTLVSAILMFANLGTDIGVIRYLSANTDDPARQRRTLGLAYLSTLVVGALSGVGLYLAAPWIAERTLEESEFVVVLRVLAVAVPFEALIHIANNAFRGLEMPLQQTALAVARKSLRLLAVTSAVLAGYSLVGVVVAYVVAAGAGFLLSMAYLLSRTGLTPALGSTREEVQEFFDYSVPIVLSRLGSLAQSRVDILMVGVFLASTEVGIYKVAVLLGGVVVMPLAGFNQIYPSAASRLYSDDEFETLQRLHALVTRWSITVCLVLAAPLIVYRREVLALFGPEFTAGGAVLVLFVCGQLVNAFSGPSNDVLTMTNHQYVVMANHWVFGALNVLGNYVLIQTLGVVGAALATASVLAVLNVTRVLEVWYLEGLVPYRRVLWKPFAAIGVAAGVMQGSTLVWSGYLAVVAGGALGVGVYAALIYLFGIEFEDRRLAGEYLGIGAD